MIDIEKIKVESGIARAEAGRFEETLDRLNQKQKQTREAYSDAVNYAGITHVYQDKREGEKAAQAMHILKQQLDSLERLIQHTRDMMYEAQHTAANLDDQIRMLEKTNGDQLLSRAADLLQGGPESGK